MLLNDKVFRTLRSAAKDSVFGICELFVKTSTKNFKQLDQKLLFCSLVTSTPVQ